MAQKNISFGNLVTPNGASLIFGAEVTNDAKNISVSNEDTEQPYTIVIDEEFDSNISADMVDYTPSESSQLSSTTVQNVIDELETLMYNAIENSTAITIDTWENANAPVTSSEINQLNINKIKNQQIYIEMENNNLINDNEIYLIEKTSAIFYAIYGETKFEEIKAAYDNQQTIACIYKNKRYYLSRIESDYAEFDFPWYEDDDKILNSTNSIFCDASSGTSSWTIGGANSVANVSSPLKLISSNATTELSSATRYYRPILVSTEAPTPEDGQIGDIWIKYAE